MELILLGAFILDLIIGDPRCYPHPVVIMGRAVHAGEKLVRHRASNARALKLGGLLLTGFILAASYLFFWGVIYLAYTLNSMVGIIASILIMSQALAVKSLYQHAMAVFSPLASGDLEQARKKLSLIVGRDTEDLQESEIVRGVVETVAENTVDGIIAPLFYALIGGPALAMAYKAINTMDSMLGYRNEPYLHLGWASARLDDIVNYIPARLTALLFLIIAPFTPGGFQGIWQCIRSDARKHPSPNSGFPEAAMAGALRVQLGGKNRYQGVLEWRATMGRPDYLLQQDHIKASLNLMLLLTAEALIMVLLLAYYCL